MDARTVLSGIPFFTETLDDRQLAALAGRAIPAEWRKGAILIREDDAASSMFVIVSGEVEVTAGGKKTRRIATLGPNAIVGEMSLLTGARRSATVTAITPVATYEIAKQALEPVLAGSPALVDRFADMLKRRQAELDAAYGPGRLGVFGLDRDNYGSLILGFFGGAV